MYTRQKIGYNSIIIKYFTIIELLVVIGIISILASMLLPALKKARETSKAVLCGSNLKNLGLFMSMYVDSFNGISVGSYDNLVGGSGTPWGDQLSAAGYLSNMDIALCPSQSPFKYVSGGRYLTYGMTVPKSWPTTDAYHVDWGGYLYAGFNFRKIRNPTITPLFCDTIYIKDGNVNNLKQCYSTYKRVGSYTSNCVHFRHSHQANFLFVDGHVKGKNVDNSNKLDGVLGSWNVFLGKGI